MLLWIAGFLLLTLVGNLLLLLLVLMPLYTLGLLTRQAWLVAIPFIAIIALRMINDHD